ncbi:hypothetical protein TRAPUB_5271 [Trametes pubescens]|uniref:Uncharacterized protein n=1 Tax=Trametes pubescens TaxID=154538 RepID=A0A1M2V938_TRAPU|nr:hypothetical protein TRAPUB_5271 [Trametes pubescens]
MPRFLDTCTGQFVWVHDAGAVAYAILSHTWRSEREGHGEQSYDDVDASSHRRMDIDLLKCRCFALAHDGSEDVSGDCLGMVRKSGTMLTMQMMTHHFGRDRVVEALATVVD